MDLDPISYVMMAKEMVREQKIETKRQRHQQRS